MGAPKFNIITDSQLFQGGTYNDINLESADSINLTEVTGVPCCITKIGQTSTNITAAAQTVLLTQSVENFDYIIIMASPRVSTWDDIFWNICIPSSMCTAIYNSSSYQLMYKGASTYYIQCYFPDDTHIIFEAAGSAASGSEAARGYIYGVRM